MELLCLDSNYREIDVVNDLISIIWTDRYYAPGDFELVVPLTAANVTKYALNSRLGRSDSKEVMTISKQEIRDDKLILTGKSLLNWLAKRYAGREYDSLQSNDPRYLFNNGLNNDLIGVSGYTQLDIYAVKSAISNLTRNGSLSGSGPTINYNISKEDSLLDQYQRIAKAAAMGIRIYLDSVDDAGVYSLKYDAYFGQDRRITQTTNAPISLSEKSGDIRNVSAVKSNEKTIDLVTVHANKLLGTSPGGTYLGNLETTVSVLQNRTVVSLNDTNPIILGPDAQFKNILRTDLTVDNFTTVSELQDELKKTAFEELDKWETVNLIDFELTTPLPIKYGIDYGLGDLITVNTNFAGSVSSRVTEIIYSKDETGEKEYPTIEIVS